MLCNLIRLTFRRNINIQGSKYSTNVQVVALAKGILWIYTLVFVNFEIYSEPCVDKDILFQCPRDYPHSCIDRKLQCNGRSECPSGDDERDCHCMLLIYTNKILFRRYFSNLDSPPAGIPIIVIVLLVFAFLFMICILSTGKNILFFSSPIDYI
jgi:hypothetical protein